jgi:hypothetical protein
MEKMWYEEIVAHFKVIWRNFLGETEENHKTLRIIVGVPAKIRTRHLLRKSQKRYHLNQLFAHLSYFFTFLLSVPLFVKG